MIVIMANEYSKWYSAHDEKEILEKMLEFTNQFQEDLIKKRKLKKKLKFWKN